MPNNLPPNWSWVKLGDVAEYINGRAFKPIEWESNGFPIIRIQNLNDESAEFNYSTKSFEKKYLVENGDLLFAWSASLGTYFWNRGKAWLNQHIFKVLPKKIISKRFLFYTLNFIIDQFYSKTHGSGMVHITKKKFEETEIPLPPLPEQKKIVEKIEELFSGLDSGVASLKKAKEQIKLYRQSVLASAFNGSLIGNGNIDEKTELPKSWKWVKLGELISPTKERFEPLENANKKYIGLEHIDKGTGKILGYADSNTVRSTKSIFGKGDLLYGKLRPYLNKVAIAEFAGVCSTDILVFNKRDGLSNLFLKYRMLMEDFVNYTQNHMSGVQHPRVNFKSLSEYELMLPQYSQQTQIVEEIEKRFSEADNLEKAIDDSLEKSEALRQSILKQAFEGKLV